MNIRTPQVQFMHVVGLICLLARSGDFLLPSQDIQKVPYLPLVYEVLFPPSPVKGVGGIHLFYELNMTSFLRSALSLRSIEVLGDGKSLIKMFSSRLNFWGHLKKLTTIWIRAGFQKAGVPCDTKKSPWETW